MRILENIHQLDVLTFYWMLRRRNRNLLVTLGRRVSATADGPLYLAAGTWFLLSAEWHIVKLLVIGFAVERSLYFTFKSLFKRNRPPAALPGFTSVVEPSDKFSFPSGHTSAAFFIACLMGFFFPWTALILYPWACCVGLARVILGVHFPTDILAGGLMGHSICLVLLFSLT